MTPRPSGRPDIVVVGSANTDLCVRAGRIPRPGETVLGGAFFSAPGGKGANQAVAAARALGPRSRGGVAFVGRVGDDDYGRRAAAAFRAEGIDIRGLITDAEAPSGVALIVIDETGENAITVAPGANARLSTADVEAASSLISSAAVVLLQLETPLEAVHRAAEIAAAAGARVILNPAPAQPLLSGDLLKHISILTPNETETEILTGVRIRDEKDLGAAADALLPIGLEAVLFTLGAQGVFAAGRERRDRIPAFPVKAVDTTAAGDVFNGALAVALAEGRSLTEAVLFANAAAAISVTRLGAQPSAPRREEIDAFWKKS